MTAATTSTAPPRRGSPSMLGAVRRALRRNHAAKVAVAILVVVVIVGVLAPFIAPHDPNAQHLELKLRPPFWDDGSEPGYVLGTDKLGRDVLSRIIFGARVSLLVGIAATLLSGIVGTAIGVVTGYYRGWRDQVFMRLADVQLAFPSILLALAIIAVLGPSLWYLILVLGLTGWVAYARVIRAEVLSLRSREFVVAARAIGDNGRQIMTRHLVPNIVAPMATIGTLQVAAMIVAEASLSYLGLGVPPDIPTWGSMLADGQLYLRTAWWVAVFSGVSIMLTTLAINVTGDMLRDVADPKAYTR